MLFKDRPLALFTLFFAAGLLFLQSAAIFTVIAAAAGTIIFIIISAFLYKKNKNLIKILLLIFSALLLSALIRTGFYYFSEYTAVKTSMDKNGEAAHVKAEVLRTEKYGYFGRYVIRVKECDGRKVSFKIMLEMYSADEINIGDFIETDIVLYSTEKSGVYNDYYRQEMIFAAGEIYSDGWEDNEFILTEAKSRGFAFYLDRFRKYIKKIFTENIKPLKIGFFNKNLSNSYPEAELAAGFFSGDRSGIEKVTVDDFRRTGLSHVLAVSGMHLSVLSGIIISLLGFLKVHKKISCIAVIIFCLMFSIFAGMSASVLRSCIMLTLYYAAFLFGRRSEPVTSLFFAGLLICVVNPYSILNLGFQLSFLSTLGIITFSSKIEMKIKLKLKNKILDFLYKSIASSLSVTLAAIIFTLPVTSIIFGAVSIISPVVNLIVALPSYFALLLSLILAVFSFLPVLTQSIGILLYYLMKSLITVVHFFAGLDFSYIATFDIGFGFFNILSVLLLVFIIIYIISAPAENENSMIRRCGAYFKYIIFITGFLSIADLVLLQFVNRDKLYISYHSKNTDQEILLIEKKTGSSSLIDISSGRNIFSGSVNSRLFECGETDLDNLILTHYHSRHLKLIAKYLEVNKIKKIYLPIPLTADETEISDRIQILSDNYLYRDSFEIIYYDSFVNINDADIYIFSFEHKNVIHRSIVINDGLNKYLYQGAGFSENYTYLNSIYDIVFYGSHLHGKKAAHYDSDIGFGSFGVISSYKDSSGGLLYPDIAHEVLLPHIEGKKQSIFYMYDENELLFIRNGGGKLKYYKR